MIIKGISLINLRLIPLFLFFSLIIINKKTYSMNTDDFKSLMLTTLGIITLGMLFIIFR